MQKTQHEHLEELLNTYKISHIDGLVKKHKDKRDEVKSKLSEYYGNSIYYLIDSGSFAKHTAINIKFDLDIVSPFKRNLFSTLEEMFNDVYNFLYNKYETEAQVKKQKVSIGLEFYQDSDGDIVNLDVVPGRELNLDTYSDNKNLKLYVNNTFGTLKEKSHIQTNIQKQIDHINAKKNEREVIRLLKVWKKYHNKSYKSFLIELITIKAFYETTITGDLWDKLKATMQYIRDHITNDGFKLVDPGNSNNDVMDTLDNDQRKNFSDDMKTILDTIESEKKYIEYYFPRNKKFEDNDLNKGYGTKLGVAPISTPPNNTRFG